MRALLFFAPLLVACSGSDDTSSSATDSGKEAQATITIASPTEGEEYIVGDPVHLAVTAKLGKDDAEVKHADWTAGSWTHSGNDVDVTDLPLGDLALTVEALVDGQTVTDTVNITIKEPPGPPEVTYAGTFSATATAHTPDLDLSGPCNGTINATAERDTKSLTGTGHCTWQMDFGDVDIDFTLDGGWTTGSLAGDLILVYDGTEYRTGYTGTGAYNEALNATFDSTITTADGSLRLNGSWSANPK